MADTPVRNNNNRNSRNNRDNNGYRGRREYNNDSRNGRENRETENTINPENNANTVDTSTNSNRNIAVDLRAALRNIDINLAALDDRSKEILTKLETVNASLEKFYDDQLNNFASEGFTDSEGRVVSPANYKTPAEKLAAIHGIVNYNMENKAQFEESYKRAVSMAKMKKEDLKRQSISILDDAKELMSENKKLMKDAEVEIEQNDEKSRGLAQKKIEEENAKKAAENSKKVTEEKLAEVKAEIEKLTQEMHDVSQEIKNAKEDEIKAKIEDPTGRQRNQVGYYTTKSKELEELSAQIKQKEGYVADYTSEILNYKNQIETHKSNIKSIEKEKTTLDEINSEKKKNLEELRVQNKELIKKFWHTKEPLENAFEKNISGMYDDGIRLDYMKESTLGKDKDTETAPTPEENVDEPTTEEKDANPKGNSAPAAGTGTVAPSSVLPDNVSESQLASNFIYHFSHNMSASERRQVINGPGFDNLISAMESASMFERRHLRYSLLNIQEDLAIPDREDFIRKMNLAIPGSGIDFDDIYDSLFAKNKDGDLTYNEFKSLSREQLRDIQKTLDYFSGLKFTGKLTEDQATLFESNFAQFAKIGILLQNDSSRFRSAFRRIFKTGKYDSQKELLISFSRYSESRFKDMNAQFADLEGFKGKLGKQVIDSPRYAENQGRVDRRNRGLSNRTNDGKMTYR